MTRSPAAFSTGIDSPVSIDSSTAPLPRLTIAVHREALAGPDEHDVAGAHARRSARRSSRPSRRTRAVDGCSFASCRSARVVWRLGARLQGVAEQDERDDEDHRFVVDVRRARRRSTNSAGATVAATRIEERRAGADRDQRVHVGRAVAEARPGARRRSAGRPTPSRRPSRRAARSQQRRRIDRVEPGQHAPQRRIEHASSSSASADRRSASPCGDAPPISGIDAIIASAPSARLTSGLRAQRVVLALPAPARAHRLRPARRPRGGEVRHVAGVVDRGDELLGIGDGRVVVTVASCVIRLTAAFATPGVAVSARCTLAWHAAHVMPSTGRVILRS